MQPLPMPANFILWSELLLFFSFLLAYAHILNQVCLEHNDLPEFNKIQPFLRCVTMLCALSTALTGLAFRDLYKEGVPGRPELIGSLQLLYWVYYSNWTEVSKLLQSQLPYKDHPDMVHAIKVSPQTSVAHAPPHCCALPALVPYAPISQVQAAINLGNWVRPPTLNLHTSTRRMSFSSVSPRRCRCRFSSCALARLQKQVPPCLVEQHRHHSV